jgi:6-phosphogluconolactonase
MSTDRHAPHLRIVADAPALAEAGARLWVDAVRSALAARGAFHVALAGGTSPRALYVAVTEQPDLDFAWHRTHVWWGDERAVPPDSPESNYAMSDATLLARVPVPAAQVHRMPADADDLDAAARAYALTLGRVVGAEDGAPPLLDLVWLGVGEDGHVASLFPGAPAVAEMARWVVAVTDAPKPPPRRLTLTRPLLDAARRIVIVACGEGKADAVRNALEPAPGAPPSPAALVASGAPGRLWLIDAAAASGLSRARANAV